MWEQQQFQCTYVLFLKTKGKKMYRQGGLITSELIEFSNEKYEKVRLN